MYFNQKVKNKLELNLQVRYNFGLNEINKKELCVFFFIFIQQVTFL